MYETTIKPVFVIQKRAVRVMMFSNFDQHSSPLFKALEIVKISDLVTYLIAIHMYKFHNQLLPGVFVSFFTKVDTVHSYNTRHIIYQKLEKIMGNSIFDFKVQKFGMQLMMKAKNCPCRCSRRG